MNAPQASLTFPLKSFLVLSLLVLSFGLITADASAQTGSRLGGSSQPVMSIMVNPDNEMRIVADLLRNGYPEVVIKRLKKYMRTVAVTGLPLGYKYQGLNAMCNAYTAMGEKEEAIKACTQAIALFPKRWEAFNTRGAAYHVRGDYTEATADYKRALKLVRNNARFADLIKNNLAMIASKP